MHLSRYIFLPLHPLTSLVVAPQTEPEIDRDAVIDLVGGVAGPLGLLESAALTFSTPFHHFISPTFPALSF